MAACLENMGSHNSDNKRQRWWDWSSDADVSTTSLGSRRTEGNTHHSSTTPAARRDDNAAARFRRGADKLPMTFGQCATIDQWTKRTNCREPWWTLLDLQMMHTEKKRPVCLLRGGCNDWSCMSSGVMTFPIFDAIMYVQNYIYF